MLINAKDSLLITIDIQERITPVMENPRAIINGSVKLIEVANILNIDHIIPEHYPKGLGETIFDIKNAAKENTAYISKTTFSCIQDKEFFEALKACKKKQIILTGLETHICVLQTAIDLKQNGYNVFVVADACGSRDHYQSSVAYQRLMQNEVEVVTTEMVIFEWLQDAKHPNFKEISKNYVK